MLNPGWSSTPRQVQTQIQIPGVWRGSEARPAAGVPSGFPGLDTLTGGWPRGALTEILSDVGGIGELRLLAPFLARVASKEKRWIALIAPPWVPYAPAFEAYGIPAERVLLIRPKDRSQAHWAAEQVLRAGTASAVLLWCDEGGDRFFRRLSLAAESGKCCGIVFRGTRHAEGPSSAALRLILRPELWGTRVEVLKRRGGIQGGSWMFFP